MGSAGSFRSANDLPDHWPLPELRDGDALVELLQEKLRFEGLVSPAHTSAAVLACPSLALFIPPYPSPPRPRNALTL